MCCPIKALRRHASTTEERQPAAIETYLPELGSDLVTALAGLNMNDFSHGVLVVVVYSYRVKIELV